MRTGRVNPREYDKKFMLEKPVGTDDAGGHVDLTDDDNWEPIGEHWLKLFKQSSREFYRAQQVQSETTHVAEVLYSNITATINTSMRWNDGQRKLNITAAFDPDDGNEVIQMRLIQQT